MMRVPAALLILSLLLAAPSPAEEERPPSPQVLAVQNLAIASAVQRQLLACWLLPSGYEGRRISVRLGFFGDGTLDGEPQLLPESIRVAGKYPLLLDSIVRAVERCLPLSGLEALGAGAGQRFDITVHFQS